MGQLCRVMAMDVILGALIACPWASVSVFLFLYDQQVRHLSNCRGHVGHCGPVSKQGRIGPVGRHKQIPSQLLTKGRTPSNTRQVDLSTGPKWVVCVLDCSSYGQQGVGPGWHKHLVH